MSGAASSGRIHIVDLEVVCPLGSGTTALLESLRADVLAGDRITRFEPGDIPVSAAAEVHVDTDASLREWPTSLQEAARFDRKLELALACATRAARFRDLLAATPPARRGIILGAGVDVSPIDKVAGALLAEGETTVAEATLARYNRLAPGVARLFNPIDLAALQLARYFECAAFQDTVLTACSASAQAIGLAFDAIRAGAVDAVVVGGTDSLLNLPAFTAFAKLGVIQPSNDGPARVCKPCDRQRRGTLLGEGAGLLLLTNSTFVEANALTPQVDVLGYGNTLDGFHITNPDPTGVGMRRAMSHALTRAGIDPAAVDYINLHGTGTRANDEVELSAIQQVFGAREQPVPVSSTKDRHGHLIAAAGIIEAIVIHQCMTHDLVPRTANLSHPIPHDRVDLVMSSNRTQPLRTCMSNSFAFGGINTSLLFGRSGE